MKTGLSLTELAKELERRSAAKADFVAPVSKLEVAVGRWFPVALGQEAIQAGVHFSFHVVG